MRIQQADRMAGTLRVPGDKSIAHRALILGSIARGKQIIEGAPSSFDVASTVSCLRSLGTFVEETPDGRYLVLAKELASGKTLDAGNSATTARILSGLLAGRPLEVTIDGDASLRGRPMDRVADPLVRMGAAVTTCGGKLPMRISGGGLKAIRYRLPVASAQVKSAILLAGMSADGETTVEETIPTRDHTERLLRAMSVPVVTQAGTVSIRGNGTPRATLVKVPGDVSSAAFFMVAALCLGRSEIYLPSVGVNPTRTGLIDVLKEMGANIENVDGDCFLEEPVADIMVKSSALKGVTIAPDRVPSLVDELPILAVAATQAEGETVVTGAGELRHKESDRIAGTVDNLKLLGADIEASTDGFVVKGPVALKGARLHAHGDHRIAMAMAIAGLLASGSTIIEGGDVVGVSYPAFLRNLVALTRSIN
jgi:3-phosphoshikimate 1-carboxyvinyltransferase